MKISLTPKLSYLLGVWKHRRCASGIGIEGGSDGLREEFAACLISCDIATADKVRFDDAKVFTYHSAYRAFLDSTLKREDDAFRYRNDFAASFFAGMFDSVGGEKKGKAYFSKADNVDEMALLRLNFKVVRAGRQIWVGPTDEFLSWIKPFRKVEMPLLVETPTERTPQGKVQRRPRRVYPSPPAGLF